MSWFSGLAGKAESLLNNLDEQTGAVLRNHNGVREKKQDFTLHPEGAWVQKKRCNPRNIKKNGSISETKSNTPISRNPPTRQPRSTVKNQDHIKNENNVRKMSPPRKAQYTLNNSPKTLVSDYKAKSVDQFGLRHRRHSLPSDLELTNPEQLTYNMQNLEVENAMLKNELNVINREISDLLDRLRKTEDELTTTKIKLKSSEKVNLFLNEEKTSLETQLQSNKGTTELDSVDINRFKVQSQELQSQISMLNDRNSGFKERVIQLTEELSFKDAAHIKLENELRHAQTTISEKQNDLDKTKEECHRLEKEWEAYKLRVKNMLFAKDNQIQSMREGANITEDNKLLLEQIEILKVEKESLANDVQQGKNEFDDMKRNMSQLEQQRVAADRLVVALRETVKEERLARNRAEVNSALSRKEMQSLQSETNQTIISLQTALQQKEEELNSLRDSSSTIRTDSVLNVADYEVTDVNSEKIDYLTQMLVQKQGKVDTLMADNNMLRIQLDKLQSKHRSELASVKAKHSHSVVHVSDDSRIRTRGQTTSPISALSVRIGVIIKRFPIFRIFILAYMIGLHLWVLTVLFTSTPEDFVPRPRKL